MNKQVTSSGMSLGTILFIVFVVMRLTDNINWAWYWVASPLWVPVAVILAAALLLFVIGILLNGLAAIFEYFHDKKALRKKRAIAETLRTGKL